jgi:TP901 family phage tail tape measure protein
MAEEITQRLGFDASRAITELRKLYDQLNQFKQGLQSTSGALRKFPSKAAPAIKAFRELATAATQAQVAIKGLGQAGIVPANIPTSAKTAATSMTNLGQQAQAAGQKVQTAVTQSFNTGATAATKLGTATKQAAQVTKQAAATTSTAATQTANALRNAGTAGEKAANAITLSWKTVIRVVQAQVIVRAISAIINAFTESQVAAAEFSTRIGEVATIAGGAIGSLDDISGSVLELSRNLGLAADEVAEGLYQTLSNQVVAAGDALRFEQQAAKLSIATHSDLKDAVNALSSVMNSYGLDVAEVEQVSDVLFKTIELGRLRLGEFGDVLGRVAPLTEALGIRYEEMAAAIAALTQKGIPAHTAITQLTQVSQKLLRPTAKLQELYRKWGVETGPEAIRRFGGLQGVLLKMKDATAGNDKEFADLLGRVRAMVGALNLTSDEANALTAALAEMEAAAGASEKAFQLTEETIGRRAVKAWNDLKVSVLSFGKSLLEITTPIVNALNWMVKNFDLVGAAILGAAGGALVLAGKFALSSISVAGLTTALVALKAALATLIPIAAAAALAFGAMLAIRALKDSLDTATEITEKYKKLSEDLTKTHEKETQKRIDRTQEEFEARRRLTGEFFSSVTAEYRKSFDLMEASSKTVGRTLDNTLSNLLDKRKRIIAEVKDAVLGADDAIKDSMEEIAKTQEAISEDAFEREIRHMSARQQVWAQIERAQDTASDARRAYAEAGANEEATRAARELSHLAESRAKEAASHAEELGNYGDLRRAEDALDKIRSDRFLGEIAFQAERKQLQKDTHKDRIKQLEEEGIRLEELLKKVRELADPITGEGILKSLEQRRADAERISELAPEIEKQMEAAFDFSMYEKLGVAESMEQVKTDLQGAFDEARIDWDKVLADFEAGLTRKTYTASVKLQIENEYIIEQFVQRFGEIDPLGDPGKLGSQMEEVLEGIVEQYEGIQEQIDQTNQKAIAAEAAALAGLQEGAWYNAYDAFTEKVESGASKIAEAYDKATGASDEYLEATYRQIPPAEQVRIKLAEAVGTLKRVRKEQRALTQVEQDSINATMDYVRAQELAGEMSSNQSQLSADSWRRLMTMIDATTELTRLYAEEAKIPPDTFETSLQALDEMRLKARNNAKAQAEMTDEASQTESELQDAKQAIIGMPTAAANAKGALAQETDQARQLKIELQGATQAQRELAQIQIQPAAAAELEQVKPPEKTKEELEAQAKAARELTIELQAVDDKFNTIFQTIDSVTQAVSGTSEIAAQIATSMDQAAIAVNDLYFGFALITSEIGYGIDLMNSLSVSIGTASTAINSASTAVVNWTTQLNNCADAGNAVAAAMLAAAKAAQSAAVACASATAACSGGSVGGAYYGGPMVRYRQEGGFSPRGQDRIPLMGKEGEFIVSERNARRFASELQAMNAGREPNYRDRGGPITNVGDINVSITQGETAPQTARQIATALRRELRRQTSRLN